MEFEYNGVSSIGKFQELKLATCFRGEEYGISSVAFDLQEDLLWAATYGVCAYVNIWFITSCKYIDGLASCIPYFNVTGTLSQLFSFSIGSHNILL